MVSKCIIAFGNALLDTVVKIPDETLLKTHNIQLNGAREITECELKVIEENVRKYEKSESAGGCSQNMLRVLKWLLNDKIHAYIVASVGNDENAALLKRLMEKDGVKTCYVTNPNFMTGTCIALILEKMLENRALLAHLGASEHMQLDNMLNIPNFNKLLTQTDIIYIESFFISNKVDIITFLLNYAKSNRKILVFNLSGEYYIKNNPEYAEIIRNLVNNCNILLGNREEFQTLSICFGLLSIEELFQKLVMGTEKTCVKTIILTDGPNNIICYNGREVLEKQVPKVENIIDTIGAGDAFAAGFLAGMILNKNVKQCLDMAIYASASIIQQSGVTIPKFPASI